MLLSNNKKIFSFFFSKKVSNSDNCLIYFAAEICNFLVPFLLSFTWFNKSNSDNFYVLAKSLKSYFFLCCYFCLFLKHHPYHILKALPSSFPRYPIQILFDWSGLNLNLNFGHSRRYLNAEPYILHTVHSIFTLIQFYIFPIEPYPPFFLLIFSFPYFSSLFLPFHFSFPHPLLLSFLPCFQP